MEPKLATKDPARDDTDPIAAAPAEAAGAEATVLHRLPADEASQPARLVVLAGPRTGLEVPITDHEVSIGRGPENLVVLPDISVSRRHAMLRREKGRYVLFDQASGNGTRLNGKPVSRSPLRSGDRIAFGDSLVEFFDPDEGTAKSAAARRSPGTVPGAPREGLSRRSIYYLAAGATLTVFFAVAGWRKHERDLAQRLAAQQAAETRALAAERFAEARTMLGEGRWNDALAKLRIAAELNPRDREIARYVKKADDEAPHAAAVAEARSAVARKDFAAAQTALSQVPEDSVLAESARDLRASLGQAMDEAVRDARKKAEANDAAGASELLAPVLAADPARSDAVAVRDALSREPVRKAPRRKSARASAPMPQGAIERAYLGGDLAAAIELAERDKKAPRAARALRDLRGFEAAYREGFAHLQAGKVREAASALDRASAFDRRIAGRPQGPLGARVRKALSSLHTEMALELTETAELPRAAAQLRAAIAEDPSNERAQKELQAAMARAHEEYMRGYVAKDSDPDLARLSFRIAAETLPASDDEAQKARRWLDKLSGGSTPREAE